MQTRIKLTNRSRYRGLTYLPHGQQMSCYLPKGEYVSDGEEQLLTSSFLGVARTDKVIMLLQVKDGTKWYVGPIPFQEMSKKYGVKT